MITRFFFAFVVRIMLKLPVIILMAFVVFINIVNESYRIDSFEHVEQYTPSKGDRQKGKVKKRNHDQREQEHDQKHEVTIVENIYDNHKRHENDDRALEHNLKCESKEEPHDYVAKLSVGPPREGGNGGTYEKERDHCEEGVKEEASCTTKYELNAKICSSKGESNLTTLLNGTSM